MKRALRSVWDVIRTTLSAVSTDRVGTMAAALAYFTFFSIAPVIIVAIAIAGLVGRPEAAQGALSRQLERQVDAPWAEGAPQAH